MAAASCVSTAFPIICNECGIYVQTLISSAPWGDRISANVLNAEMAPEFSRNMPIFSFSLGGVILNPNVNELFCSYAFDADTLERQCHPRGASSTCTPGCSHPDMHAREGESVQWCTDVNRDEWPCAWRPEDTGRMLQRRENIRASGQQPPHKRFNDGKFYIEAMFDAAAFTRQLPHAIEAVFFLKEDCTDSLSGPKCEDYSRTAHATLLEHFGLTNEQLPLLQFDPWNWEAPFTLPS